jgi:hypothetical protein
MLNLIQLSIRRLISEIPVRFLISGGRFTNSVLRMMVVVNVPVDSLLGNSPLSLVY